MNTTTHTIIRRFIDRTMSADLLNQTKRWLISHRNEVEKEEVLQHLWHTMPIASDAKTLQSFAQTEQKIKMTQSPYSHRLFIRKIMQYAALFLLPILTAFGTYLYMESADTAPEMIECFVPNGEHRQIRLADGSQVNVNAGSLLVYPKNFEGKTRTIYLSGEANFDVSKDKKKPFIVKTSHIAIQALGTKFNVQAYHESGKTLTTLEQGSVRVYKVDSIEQQLILAPNQQAIYNHQAGSLSRRNTNAADYSAWTKGELYLTKLSLNEIFTTLERRFGIHIQINARVVNTDYFTMKFRDNETIREVMDVVVKTVGNITYKQQGTILQVYPLKEEKEAAQ